MKLFLFGFTCSRIIFHSYLLRWWCVCTLLHCTFIYIVYIKVFIYFFSKSTVFTHVFGLWLFYVWTHFVLGYMRVYSTDREYYYYILSRRSVLFREEIRLKCLEKLNWNILFLMEVKGILFLLFFFFSFCFTLGWMGRK